MIPLREQEAIRQRFAEEMKGTVKIDFFTRRPAPVFVPGREDCPYCPQAQQIIEELAHLSDRIDLRVHQQGEDRALEERYGMHDVPAIVVRGAINRPLVQYGFPTGVLFSVLLESIIDASGPVPDPPPLVKRRLKRLKRPVTVQVFTLPDDQNGAIQARTAQVIALASQHIRAETIEAAEFPRLVEQYGVRATPTTVINGGKGVLLGVQSPEDLVDQIVRTADQQLVSAKNALTAGLHEASATPFPQQPRQPQKGTVRPSGLIIPGRGG
jgi:glutaredoxin